MITVHDGTPNNNKRNVINVKCVNCVHCINFVEGYYFCDVTGKIELIEECVANDDNMGCDVYVEDRNDDFTARS